MEALARAVPVPDLARRIEVYTDASDLRVACIECNDDQAGALCAELTRAFGVRAIAKEIDKLLASPDPRKALADVDLLVTTPFHSGEVEELGVKAGKSWLCMPPRSDLFLEIAELLQVAPVHYAVADQRFAKQLKKIFRNAACGDRLIPLVTGTGDIASARPDIPLYITQRAREQLGPAVPAHARPSVCVFAPTAARAMLTFIVMRNIARDGTPA